mgnify:CR=1 FL=1
MNMMAVHKDGHVETPSLTGNILPGVTRRSLIQLLQDKARRSRDHDCPRPAARGHQVRRSHRGVRLRYRRHHHPDRSLQVREVRCHRRDGGSGKLTCELRDELLGIQLGEVEDPHNWMWKVC